MLVVGRLMVRNITGYDIFLCSVRMKKAKTLGYIMVKDSKTGYDGSYVIPPASITEISFLFWVIPALKKLGEPFVTDIALIDQFSNEHWVKNIEFLYNT